MGAIDLSGLPPTPLLFLDSAPIIYWIEGHKTLAARFEPVFAAQRKGEARFAISSLAIAEVLTGPLKNQDEALARAYRSTLETWIVVPVDGDINESAARLRATLGLKLADAVQAASALSIGADALITHGRDFTRLRALRVIA